MAVIRREEQTAAAAVVGVKDVTFLGYPDGRLMPSIELRRDISREIRTGATGPGGVPVARADVGQALRQPSGPSRRGRSDGLRGLPRCA